MNLPSLETWLHVEFIQLLAAFRSTHPGQEPPDDWQAFQTYRRYVDLWPFERMLAWERSQGTGTAPITEPVHPAVSLTRPTTDRRSFLVNGQPWRYKGADGFKLMEVVRQGGDPRPFVRAYTAEGVNTFRILANKPAAAGFDPGWTTPPLSVALDTFAMLKDEGARGEVTLFGSQVDSSFVPSWIDALRDQCPHAFVEGVNEPGHDNQWPTTTPIDALVLPRRGDLPYATGNYDTYDHPAQQISYGTIHTERAGDPFETARKAKAVLEMYDGWTADTSKPIGPDNYTYAGVRVPWIGDEPGKPQDIGNNVDAIVALFAIYGLFGGGGTFHTLSGQFCQMPSETEMACLRAAMKGLDAFPAGAPNQGSYVHDRDDEAATGSLRTYRNGPYGVRVRPTSGAPILIGV